MKEYDIYGIGNALVDIEVLIGPEFLKKMEIEKGVMSLVDKDRQELILSKLEALQFSKCCGGSAANTAIAVNQLGGKSFYSCSVSTDRWGDFYHRDLLSHGIKTNIYEQRAEGTTGTCVVMVTPDADRTMNTHLGVSQKFSKNELHIESIKKSKVFFVEGYILPEEDGLEAALIGAQVAKENGVKIALTLSDKTILSMFREQFDKLIGDGVDAIFCNLDEARAFAGSDDLEEVVSYMKKYSKMFAITLGEEGALVVDGDRRFTVGTEKVNAVDTLGAGDLFAGCFLYGITNDIPLERAASLACSAASNLCAKYGTRLHTKDLLELKDKFLNN